MGSSYEAFLKVENDLATLQLNGAQRWRLKEQRKEILAAMQREHAGDRGGDRVDGGSDLVAFHSAASGPEPSASTDDLLGLTEIGMQAIRNRPTPKAEEVERLPQSGLTRGELHAIMRHGDLGRSVLEEREASRRRDQEREKARRLYS